MALLKAYQYFFYRLYMFYENSMYSRWWSDWKAHVTILALSIWFYSSLKICYHYFLNVPIVSSDDRVELDTFIFVILVSIVNWFLFSYQNKWKKHVIKFDKLSSTKNRLGGIIVSIIVVSIIVFYWFYAVPLLGKVKYTK